MTFLLYIGKNKDFLRKFISRKNKMPTLAKIKCLQSVTNSLPF